MRNLLLTLRFIGTEYCGFQFQNNGLSVAEVFSRAAESVLGERPQIKGCSRTDAGVHALGYALSLKTNSSIPAERLPIALNTRLPQDVAVTSCREVGDDFHARYCAKSKQYIYKILNTGIKDPFYEGLALRHPKALDENQLNAQALDYIGAHDFSAFCNAGGNVSDKVRNIYKCSVAREGDIVLFSVTGDGFLYNMVRIMVGTLLDISSGKIAKGSIKDIIASRDRERAGITAPAHGLYLARVDYTGLD